MRGEIINMATTSLEKWDFRRARFSAWHCQSAVRKAPTLKMFSGNRSTSNMGLSTAKCLCQTTRCTLGSSGRQRHRACRKFVDSGSKRNTIFWLRGARIRDNSKNKRTSRRGDIANHLLFFQNKSIFRRCNSYILPGEKKTTGETFLLSLAQLLSHCRTHKGQRSPATDVF